MSIVSKFIRNIGIYCKNLPSQLRGWPLPNYFLWFFSLGVQLMIMIQSFGEVNKIGMASIITTFIGTNLGVGCIISINAKKSINGILGLVSALCFIWVGWHARNYLSCLEQLGYAITLDIPVLANPKWNQAGSFKVKTFHPLSWTVAIASTLVAAGILGELMNTFTTEPRPWLDALSLAVSFTAGIICTLRYNDQYFWWLASSVCQIALWFLTFKQGDADPGMLVNAIIYLVNDFIAFAVSPWFHARL